jgi:hypothetical protein
MVVKANNTYVLTTYHTFEAANRLACNLERLFFSLYLRHTDTYSYSVRYQLIDNILYRFSSV